MDKQLGVMYFRDLGPWDEFSRHSLACLDAGTKLSYFKVCKLPYFQGTVGKNIISEARFAQNY